MKVRSDTVPAWPVAMMCTGVILLAVVRPLFDPKRPRPVFNSRGLEVSVSPEVKWSHTPQDNKAVWLYGAQELMRPQYSEWGIPTEGIQLLVRVDERVGGIATWLRNASTNRVFLHDWELLSSRSIAVELRHGAEWVRLPRATRDDSGADGDGPTGHALLKLDPGECVASYPMLWIYHGLPNVDPAQRMGRPFPATEPIATALLAVVWPRHLSSSNQVSVRLVQTIAVPDEVTPWFNRPDPVASFESLARLRHIISNEPKPGYRTKGWHWVGVTSAPVDIDPRRVMAATKARRQP